MKRTLPLLITAIGGFILIVAKFIPATEDWGEVAAIWFDILAAIAFILGGGNLMKVHLKKISDRVAGWGYSAITIISFLVMLGVGLLKLGAPPASDQEFFGETFAPLTVDQIPESMVFKVPGDLPEFAKETDRELPASVRHQLTVENGELIFRGWILGNQVGDLLSFSDELKWQCAVDKLAETAQPPKPLAGKVNYYSDHRAFSFSGPMTPGDQKALLQLSDADRWRAMVEILSKKSQVVKTVEADEVPSSFEGSLRPYGQVRINEKKQLEITGPMSLGLKSSLTNQFPIVRPYSEEEQKQLFSQLELMAEEPLNDAQRKAITGVVNSVWSAEQLVATLNGAGVAKPTPKTACEMLAEQEAGVEDINPEHPKGDDVELNDDQKSRIQDFIDTPDERIPVLAAALKDAGELTGGQAAVLNKFLSSQPTVGQHKREVFRALMSAGSFSNDQADYLLADYRTEVAWAGTVHQLFKKAHVTKYPWSGVYNANGSPFWWLYEYAFKPLQATVFALLAFYVASAAFRAFRAKNLEAILLLGTAFIILLGRTFAGVWLTSGFPEAIGGLRVENLTVWIMSVVNTAGNRAIMIGIALGIASTSLKVLIGVDRSYLGSGDD